LRSSAVLKFVNSARLANSAAGISVSKKGTSQVTRNELRRVLMSRPHFKLQEKIHDLNTAEDRVAAWRNEGLTIGFTNGCFDLLHPGHLHLLCEARNYCDRLIVGLNSDSSVRRLKGPARPIQPEAARSIILAGLAFVDSVILFQQDTPMELIKHIKPDILIKGDDYGPDQVIGREFVQSCGGRLVLIETIPDFSTTFILNGLKGRLTSAGPDVARMN
jgi:D-beta-D-heptose 7-phosphate kinase / D-beta-D-heptose 1-phosphate adenosyltransferase